MFFVVFSFQGTMGDLLKTLKNHNPSIVVVRPPQQQQQHVIFQVVAIGYLASNHRTKHRTRKSRNYHRRIRNRNRKQTITIQPQLIKLVGNLVVAVVVVTIVKVVILAKANLVVKQRAALVVSRSVKRKEAAIVVAASFVGDDIPCPTYGRQR